MRQVLERKDKQGNASYQVRYVLDGVQSSFTSPDKTEATRFRDLAAVLDPRSALAQMEVEDNGPAIPTWNDMAAYDRAHPQRSRTAGTTLKYQREWDETFAPLIGNHPVNLLTQDKTQDVLNELSTRYSENSMLHFRALLSNVVKRAVQKGHVSRNMVAGCYIGRGNEADETEMTIISPEQFDVFINVLAGNRYWCHYVPFFRFLFGTGCRYGEIVALQVGDVDLAAKTVWLRRGKESSVDGAYRIGNTKTRRGKRKIFVCDELVDDLRQLTAGKKPGQLVFTAKLGGRVNQSTVWRVWEPALRQAGLQLRIHDLRHSHASLLLAQGTRVEVVSQRLGHKSVTVTWNTYRHLFTDELEAAAAAASLAFAPRTPGKPQLRVVS